MKEFLQRRLLDLLIAMIAYFLMDTYNMDPSSNIKSVLHSCCTKERDNNRFSSELTNADDRETSCLHEPDSSNEEWGEDSFVSLRDVGLGDDFEPHNLRLDKPEQLASGSSRRCLKQEHTLPDEDLELFDDTDHSEERIDSREVALLNRITRRQGIPRSKSSPQPSDDSIPPVRAASRSSGASASARAANAANAAQKNLNRRRQIDPTTCERDYSREEIEFMRAMDNYKRTSGRMFPTCSEILEVVRNLGYVKIQNGPY